MGAKSDHFSLFSAYFGVFSLDLWMEYRIFISIVDISAKILNQLEFGISNRANVRGYFRVFLKNIVGALQYFVQYLLIIVIEIFFSNLKESADNYQISNEHTKVYI